MISDFTACPGPNQNKHSPLGLSAKAILSSVLSAVSNYACDCSITVCLGGLGPEIIVFIFYMFGVALP